MILFKASRLIRCDYPAVVHLSQLRKRLVALWLRPGGQIADLGKGRVERTLVTAIFLLFEIQISWVVKTSLTYTYMIR